MTPIGVGRKSFWSSLLANESGVGPITLFDPEGFDVKIAAECTDFAPTEYIDGKLLRRIDRFCQMALASSKLALEDADAYGLLQKNPQRVAVVLGTALGGVASMEQAQRTLDQQGPDRLQPFAGLKAIPNLAAAYISIQLGVQGPSATPALACSCGTEAMGVGFDLICRGEADMVICGAAEAPITPVVVAGFTAIGAMSQRNDDPMGACRPFDRDHSGFVIAEGGATLILESTESVERRGVDPYAKITGIGRTTDAYHTTSPYPEGRGILRAMQLALKQAGLEAEQIGYLNPHGTGTVAGDGPESWAIHCINPKVRISATKSTLGHSMGACGAIETAICALAIKEKRIPPMRNLENVAEECASLDYVVGRPRPAPDLEVGLCTNSAFGGHNTAVVLESVS
ncbi:MAG: beta-ketoacyl-[acyl-carrier-protein] synthase family protein [Actinomycetota bacterium]|nr:beta-ketoacyl-[acyl-carrier-protein] synthase family protein [Actinomycetota bacterium]